MKNKIIFGFIIVFLLIILVGINLKGNKGIKPIFGVSKSYDVKVRKVNKGKFISTVQANGVVEEFDRINVFFETPLRVIDVLVKENHKVVKGQKLVELDLEPIEIELQQMRIEKELLELEIKKINMTNTNYGIENIKKDINAAKTNYDIAIRAYEEAKEQFIKSEKLYESLAISKNAYEQARKNEEDLKDAMNIEKLNLNKLEHSLEQTKVNINNDKLIKEVNLHIQNQKLELIELKISKLEELLKRINESIQSSIDGFVSEVNIENGAFTNTNQYSFIIMDINQLIVKADVKANDVNNLEIGQEVIIKGQSIPSEISVLGKITSISPIAKKVIKNTGEQVFIEVEISVFKNANMLMPGLNTTCEILTKSQNDATIIHFDVIKVDKDGKTSVFVVNDENIMKEVFIELGDTSGLEAEVINGLEEGAVVVIDPQPNYTDGSKVNIISFE